MAQTQERLLSQTAAHRERGAFTGQTEKRTTAPSPAMAGMMADAGASLVARGVGAVALATIGLIHLLDAPGKLGETPYMFWLYLALIAGCLLGAALLLRAHSRASWAMAAVLGVSPFLGYVLDRTTGLPGATGDIGNWTEPLGMASLFVETCVITLSVYGFTLLRRTPSRV